MKTTLNIDNSNFKKRIKIFDLSRSMVINRDLKLKNAHEFFNVATFLFLAIFINFTEETSLAVTRILPC